MTPERQDTDPATAVATLPARLPARPVLSEACQRRIAEAVAAAPPLNADQRARIGLIIRTGRRLGRVEQPGTAA
ncbi:MAG TPA: hypothetical protein VFQ42_19185 [Mycobacterium sp.]|nr:hypothetical protein [Mycobacterium sp.]